MVPLKNDLLQTEIRHIDITQFNSIPILKQFSGAALQAKNIARAAQLYIDMLTDKDCTIILSLAGSLFSAGLKKVVYDLLENNMVDVIISTGAIIVDQDFFEALGFKHYQGTFTVDDSELLKQGIDRIYDVFIDEDELRQCDMAIAHLADRMPPQTYSSREFIKYMGQYIQENSPGEQSVVRISYKKGVPIFVPAFSDSSAGFGLVYHQWNKQDGPHVAIDSVKDFVEFTTIKIAAKNTGIIMVGGGVPKNFTQDVTIAAHVLGKNVQMHKYAVQITVADERDGGLSGSTLKEALSWGKVDKGQEQMVFSEATLAFPLIASYAYHSKVWKKRKAKKYNHLLDKKIHNYRD
jgi:deoxyhypusine synthase